MGLKLVSVGAKNPREGMCDYAAQYLVYYSVPPAAQSGVDREVPVVARPVAKIVQNIAGLEGWAHAQDV